MASNKPRKQPTRKQLIELAKSFGVTQVDEKPLSRCKTEQLKDAIYDAMWKAEQKPDRPSRTEMKLLREACLENYKIPAQELEAMPSILLAILADPAAPRRTRVVAGKTLLEVRKFKLAQALALLRISEEGVDPDEAVRLIQMPFKPER